jgi:fibronectin-binding autotransporter adhesin
VNLGRITLTVGGNGTSTTFAGVIADGGIIGGTGAGLTKVGAGTLTLSGANTYTGTPRSARARCGSARAARRAHRPGGEQCDAGLQPNTDGGQCHLGHGRGAAGRRILTGANTYSGTTNIGEGSLQVGAGGTTGTLGTGNVVNGGALAFNRSDAVTLSPTRSRA